MAVSERPTWQEAMRILCVRLDGMGDVLMTAPALRALKDSVPGREITLLTSPAGAAVAEMLPEVDDVIEYDAPWVKGDARRVSASRDRRMIAELRMRRFDAAVVFTVSTQNPAPAAMLCHLAEVPLRLAYGREKIYDLVTDRVPDVPPTWDQPHEVRRQLDLVAAVGARTADERLSLQIPPWARWRARLRLRGSGLDASRPWAAVHPGASASSRRYPPGSFSAAAQLLSAQGLQVLFTGDPTEHSLVEQIRSRVRAPTWSLVGQLRLPELAAVIAEAPVFVSNNTGPAHIAPAVGTPVVVLYAQTNPQHTPWGGTSRVLTNPVPCRNCLHGTCPLGHHACLRAIPPERVAEAVLELSDPSRTDATFASTPA